MGEENGNTIDYRVVLADMEAKRAALDNAIASLRNALPALIGPSVGDAFPGLADGPPVVSLGSAHSGEIPAGAFFKKSIIEAAKLYLSLVKRKKTTHEIAVALREGGMETHSKNFERMVGILLKRASKSASGGIVKLKDGWGLSDWYPAGFRITPGKQGIKKKASNRRIRAKKTRAKNSPQSGSGQKLLAVASDSKVKEMPKAG